MHEERNVLERVAIIKAETATHHVFSRASDVIGKSKARTEVLGVIVWQVTNERIGDGVGRYGHQFLIRTAIGNVRLAEGVVVPIPANAEVQGQARRDLPIVLEVEAKLFRGHDKLRIAC